MTPKNTSFECFQYLISCVCVRGCAHMHKMRLSFNLVWLNITLILNLFFLQVLPPLTWFWFSQLSTSSSLSILFDVYFLLNTRLSTFLHPGWLASKTIEHIYINCRVLFYKGFVLKHLLIHMVSFFVNWWYLLLLLWQFFPNYCCKMLYFYSNNGV